MLGGLGIAGYAIDEKVRSWEGRVVKPSINPEIISITNVPNFKV